MAALLCLLFSTASAAGIHRALLIGCDRFLSQEDTWPASANNVRLMAAALSGGNLPMARLTTRRAGIAGLSALETLIADTFAEAENGDISWLYISTHGLWSQGLDNSEIALLLSDGTQEEQLTALRLKALLDEVPGTKVLLIDACHAGAMIGKGVLPPFDNIFAGDDYKVICSSGGTEDSWFWSGASESARLAGAGYFSGALISGLSRAGGYAADANRDGAITLRELRQWLRANHGASTVFTYPEEDDSPLFTYHMDTFSQVRTITQAVSGITFEEGALQSDESDIRFSFTVNQAARLAYQVVYQRGGRWDFENAAVIYDTAEGNTDGALGTGYQERTIHLNTGDSPESYGYALLQVLILDGENITVGASRVLCVPPAEGDPQLAVLAGGTFCPAAGEELTAVALHSLPCELSAWIERPDGEVVRRLCVSEPTRPEQLQPGGTTLVWNGLLANGTPAAEGTYCIHIRSRIGSTTYDAWSAGFELVGGEG